MVNGELLICQDLVQRHKTNRSLNYLLGLTLYRIEIAVRPIAPSIVKTWLIKSNIKSLFMGAYNFEFGNAENTKPDQDEYRQLRFCSVL